MRAASLRSRRHRLGAGEMEEVDRAARGVREHERLGDRQLLGERGPRLVIGLEAFGARAPRLFDEHAEQLRLLAVQAERHPAARPVRARGRRHARHQSIEVTEIVGVGHRVVGAARRVRREVQPFVKHVVLERGDALVAHEPVDLVELVGGHDPEVVAEIGMSVPLRGRDDLGKDRAIRPGLVQIVAARAEIAHHRRDAACERGARLTLRVDGEIAIDPDVEVRVDRARQHEPASRVEDLVRVAWRDRIGERRDPPFAHADISAHRPDVGQNHGAVDDRGVVPGHRASSSRGGLYAIS